ncbi:MAG: anti-sigma factor [bacterium]
MSEADFTPEEADDALAGEYVTGLLDRDAWNDAESRLRRDPLFAARVADWEQRLSGLNDDYAEVPVPELWPRIESRLFPRAAKRGWLSSLWAWGAAGTAAVAVVAYLALSPAQPSLTATLVAVGSTLKYEAVITQDKLTLTRVSGNPADAQHSLELWIIAGDNPPVSLGVIAGDRETISLPGVEPGQLLAVTLEPLGGSPTGKPTLPPLAIGKLDSV